MQTHFTHLQQTAFESMLTKGEIAHDDQFLLFFVTIQYLLYFHSQIYSIFCLYQMYSMSSARRFAVCGKELNLKEVQSISGCQGRSKVDHEERKSQDIHLPLPTCRHILMHVQQTVFENSVAKGELRILLCTLNIGSEGQIKILKHELHSLSRTLKTLCESDILLKLSNFSFFCTLFSA